MENNSPILEMKAIRKSFGAVQALNDVDLKLYPKEILGMVGDNGAGKSTLVKIISGVIIPDSGEIYLDGNKVNIKSSHDARELGIETVYQDLALLETLDVSKNIFLGREPRIWKFFYDYREMKRKTKEILENLDIDIPYITSETRFLSGGQRQAIAVSRATFWGCKIVIMDEPTAALGVRESIKVLDLVKKLKEKGVSIIIISHNLEHVFKVSDRIVVLRKGRRVAERIMENTNGDEVVKLITGAEFATK